MFTLADIANLKDEYLKKLRAEGEPAVKQAFKEFFTKHPYVESIKWEQYTPYFNDGDPCEFNVYDLYVELNDINYFREVASKTVTWESSYDYNTKTTTLIRPYSDEELLEKIEDDGGIGVWSLEENTQLHKDLDEIQSQLQSCEELMLTLFGDHVTVRVTKNKVETEECNHD